jgi:hypothetical protein
MVIPQIHMDNGSTISFTPTSEQRFLGLDFSSVIYNDDSDDVRDRLERRYAQLQAARSLHERDLSHISWESDVGPEHFNPRLPQVPSCEPSLPTPPCITTEEPHVAIDPTPSASQPAVGMDALPGTQPQERVAQLATEILGCMSEMPSDGSFSDTHRRLVQTTGFLQHQASQLNGHAREIIVVWDNSELDRLGIAHKNGPRWQFRQYLESGESYCNNNGENREIIRLAREIRHQDYGDFIREITGNISPHGDWPERSTPMRDALMRACLEIISSIHQPTEVGAPATAVYML